jgi:hypothetical protein
MKKIFLSLALVLAMGLTVSAQEGLFGYGPDRGSNLSNRDGEPAGLMLPSSHGSSDDVTAPLGTGTALLLGMGAAYMIAKKRKK